MVPGRGRSCATSTAVVEGLKGIANLDGMLVTIPHKFDVVRHADIRQHGREALGRRECTPTRRSTAAGRATTSTGKGFVAGLEKTRARRRAAGASRSSAPAARVWPSRRRSWKSGVGLLSVFDLSVAKKSQALAGRLNDYRAGSVVAVANPKPFRRRHRHQRDADGPAREGPATLRRRPRCPEGVVVAEVIMKPHDTKLLKAAAAKRGLPIHHGINMLAPQIEMYRKFFRISAAEEDSARRSERTAAGFLTRHATPRHATIAAA